MVIEEMTEREYRAMLARTNVARQACVHDNQRLAKPLGEAGPWGRDYPIERRNPASRQALLHRIAMEYDEMPGLRLTAAQAQRLFGLREDICMRVFNELVDAAILRRDVTGYARNGRP